MTDDPNHPLIHPDDPWAVSTYAALAETFIDRPGGRYAATAPATATRLPAPGWDDPSGPEPPLGYDINEVPDLGFMDVAPGMGAQASDREARLEEALQRIAQWADAYPLDIFPEPEWKKARALLEAGGITLDSISAHCMRHVIEGVGKIALEALAPTDP